MTNTTIKTTPAAPANCIGYFDTDGPIYAADNRHAPADSVIRPIVKTADGHLAVATECFDTPPHSTIIKPVTLKRTGGIRRGGWVAVEMLAGECRRNGWALVETTGWFKPAPAKVHPADLSIRS